MEKSLGAFDWVCLVLVLIGGLNWGLVGFFQYDLVAKIFGDMNTFTRVIYDLVGLSALYLAVVSPNLARK